MMLVHKPPSFNIAPTVPHAHRRHPSAPPAVVVQPTKTPGLLSISKPARTTHNRHMNSHQRRENNNAKAPSKTAKSQAQPLVARAPALLNPAEISHKKPAPPALQDPASPTPQQRGRGSKHAREKAQQQKRTHSQSPVRGKHSRQPSPPVEIQIQQQSLQAEVKFPSSNHFDPFLEQLSGAMPTPSPSPKQQHKQNRKQQQQQSPPVSESIPVTRIVRPKPQNISR
ncbi:hypothetical protein CC1G_07687 [Coprinopsis cinerea okayama7|uniref:Uncharacterized protein n=1 Tax=Coprinopsis cinerea (strain Okayama-7 / 130 / ATCC MYA-4618 / FGSC 9003) TaxID=240176 RepID=A8NC00_COPC7|nr:hypothetical protein CC1G_07687 [Coprinopsis cinerea okayama7\|eukprot:XP_001832300.2 hypothetical protein CC1G_07687 [Coprinopsis cinerea okayama7\